VTRQFGIDISHYQDPAAPAGFTYKAMRAKSSFAIVRASYGQSPDDRASLHIANARKEQFQVGLYHFFVLSQPVDKQMDVFLAQALKCGIGKGDIVPALDCEDDGKNVLTRAAEPLIHQACDILCSEFGSAMPYFNQAGWIALGEPKWMLDLPNWVANYTNGPRPFLPATVWQNRVGPYAPGAPFVLKEAYAPNAIDQDVCDGDLPLATSSPSLPRFVIPVPSAPPAQQDLWQRRLDALTTDMLQQLDTDHSDESFQAYDDQEAPTNPSLKS
jgi:hypothetical protein